MFPIDEKKWSPHKSKCPSFKGTVNSQISTLFFIRACESHSQKKPRSFKSFYESLKAVSFGINVQPRRLLYIDNRMALHSRDQFWGSFDRYKNPIRLIQRVFVSADLWNRQYVEQIKERVFDFQY